jgi:hypothetical protein
MIRSSRSRAFALAGACALACASPALAVQFTLESHVGNVWTYTLTYDPLDNYNTPSTGGFPATITLSGLAGVTDASPPTSTDFDPPGGDLDLWNLAWQPTVLAGGTRVVWANDGTESGTGTGNFGVAKHSYGFTILSSADPGSVRLDTSGFGIEDGADTDVNDADATGPAPEPGAAASAGVAVFALFASRRRQMKRAYASSSGSTSSRGADGSRTTASVTPTLA